MPDIIVCFKWVIDEAYIRTGSSGALDFRSVNYKLSDYDRNAIEAAVRLKEECGGTVTAVTVGTPGATKGLKDALSRGPDKACFVNDQSFDNLEPSQTAAILTDVIKGRLEYDLIICGEGSSDLYAQQVGPRLAEALGIPCVSFVQKLSIDGNRIIAERKVEEGINIMAAQLPALVTVVPDINNPRIPGVKDTLMASKKEVISVTADDLPATYEPALQTVSMTAASMERNCITFPADQAGIQAFVEALAKEGVLR
ncbi:MAG: electron transfer flavoprotein subunit beta/FixA family protein [Deltaproteobacteria bacterium]|nr:electron transfer flavoprotein subunit beta/FixA family protein [Deltaproteobacteria bacterium]MBN2688948.1 electron transfer flavoprotein subunit beta/FixA family protein [Deltaproteobacteria bacterium]